MLLSGYDKTGQVAVAYYYKYAKYLCNIVIIDCAKASLRI